MGAEFIDLEMTMPDFVIQEVTETRGSSRIIASHHDPGGSLSWKNWSWMPLYNRALQHGDVIKLVGVATRVEDNFDLARFKDKVLESYNKPMIALNMGSAGKLSRILNGCLTPVSHPALPFKAAPGQLSAAEIRSGLSMLGMLTEKHFFLFGKPISASRSPALHNSLFQQTGLPHSYSLFETDVATDIQNLIRSDDFGGASVTIPLKLDVIEFLDEVTDSAKTIGAVNTIIPSSPTSAGPARLIGDNTDWLGMAYSLKSAGAVCQAGLSALVIGSGGTSRAAIYALQSMGYSPVYLTARNATNCQKLITSLPSTFPIKVATHSSDLGGARPNVIISTVPADQNMDSGVAEVVSAALSPDTAVETAINSHESSRILLEMAYTPRHTPLMQRAEESGWTTIPGLEVLAAQGWHQVSLADVSFCTLPLHSLA